MAGAFLVAMDLGTTAIKGALYRIEDDTTSIVASTSIDTKPVVSGDKVEMDLDELWDKLCDASRALTSFLAPGDKVIALGFSCPMMSLNVIGRDGRPLRRSISYLDSRCGNSSVYRSLGAVARNLIKTGVAAVSAKDVLYKYQWIRRHEPEVFADIHKVMDMEDYLAFRCTGELTMGEDSAFLTFLYNVKTRAWEKGLARQYGVDPSHLCERVISSSQARGYLSEQAAAELGIPLGAKGALPEQGSGAASEQAGEGFGVPSGVSMGASVGVPVYAAGDMSCITEYASDGASSYVYWGTSGWVLTPTKKPLLDLPSNQATIAGANPAYMCYMGQMETAGKNLEWILSVVGKSYADIPEALERTQLGAGGVMYAPWINGERCPFNDATARGGFVGINLNTKADDLVRAVIEGICLEYAWIFNLQRKKFEGEAKGAAKGKSAGATKSAMSTLAFCGGGAKCPEICQLLSDVMGCTIVSLKDSEYCGANGIVTIAMNDLLGSNAGNDLRAGEDGCDGAAFPYASGASSLRAANGVYAPDPEKHQRYQQLLKRFKGLRRLP